jgi:hypothetical protein
MAATKKSAKRSARKKRKSAKRPSAKKRPARKAVAKGRTRRRAPKSAALKRTAKKGLRVAQEGIETVRQAGEKTWGVLKSTTTQVVEGVRDKLGQDSDRNLTDR